MSLNLIESNQFIFLLLRFFCLLIFLFLSLLRLVFRIYLLLLSLVVVVFLWVSVMSVVLTRTHTLFTQYTRTKKTTTINHRYLGVGNRAAISFQWCVYSFRLNMI